MSTRLLHIGQSEDSDEKQLLLMSLALSILVTHSLVRSLANNEDPDEMPHDAAFHPRVNTVLLWQKHAVTKTIFYIFYVEIITCDPSVYTMDQPKFIVSNQKEEFINV